MGWEEFSDACNAGGLGLGDEVKTTLIIIYGQAKVPTVINMQRSQYLSDWGLVD